MGIKQSKGKLTLAVPLEQYIQEKLTLEDYKILPITLKQLAKITTLPFHHNDPFDRLLIAQAITEQIPPFKVKILPLNHTKLKLFGIRLTPP